MAAAATKNVTGFLTNISAAEIDGAVLRFNPDPAYIVASGGTIAVGVQTSGVAGEVVTPVASDGSFTAPIIAADNAQWTITVTVDGPNIETPLPSFVIEPPPASGSGDVTIDTLVKVAPSGDTPALVASITSMQDYDNTTAPTDGEVLAFNAATGKWHPVPQSGGGVGTVQSVNGITPDGSGDVNLTPSAIGAMPATTLATVATTGAYADLTGKPTIPATAADVGAIPVPAGISDGETAVWSASSGAWVATPVTAAGNAANVPTVGLDSFVASGDDAKLAAAMSYAASQTYPPTIQLSNRLHSFTQGVTLYDGFRLQGPPGSSNAEKSAVNMVAKCDVNIPNGIWLNATSGSQNWDIYIGQLSFNGHSTTQWMGCTNGGLDSSLFRDLSFASFKSVLGSQATKMLLTACTFSGWWEVNNSYNGAIHIGGSDNSLWQNGMLLDSATAFNSSGNAAGQFHLWCDSLEKTAIGPIYVTCEGNWGGIKVSGPAYNSGGTNMGYVVFNGIKCEGRNPGAPCNGANIRVEGGIVTLRDSWVSYGMASPTSMGHTPTDAGIVHVTAGRVQMDGCIYDHATSIAESVPFVYQGGGQVRISNQMVGSRGGVWTGLPQVHAASGSITADSTVSNV